MAILIFLLIYIILFSVGCYLLFPKLGIDPWRGLVPVLNVMEISEKIGRSRWYGLLSIVPIVSIFIVTGVTVALIRSFGRYGLGDAAIGVIFAPLSLYKLSKDDTAKYEGPILDAEKDYMAQIKKAKDAGHKKKLSTLMTKNPYAKSVGREWLESIVFAVFAAAFIRMFLVEAYVIPTPSMEGSMLVGDFLFVSKSSYGIRTPQTIAMIPLLHNRIPKLGKESYLKKPSLPYYRLPAIRDIKQNGPIVFNWPVGDSVYITKSRSYTVGQIRRQPEFMSDPELPPLVAKKDFVVRPMDKKDHYIKRAMGIPGDSLQIIDTQVYINGKPAENPEHMQFRYIVTGSMEGLNPRKLEEWGIEPGDVWAVNGGQRGYWLDQTQVDKIMSAAPGAGLVKVPNSPSPKKLFPHDPEHFPGWSVDDYGPIYIPKKGETTPLNESTIALYRKLIADYEHNDLEVKGGQFYVNGEVATSYTFKQDYYWAMGDNRHNSEDSRMWGFVPHDHIVGKPLFIWFSTKGGSIANGIRWERLFKSATNI